MKRYNSINLLLLVALIFTVKFTAAQTFKLVVTNFEDRTGRLAKTEAETKANVTGGAVIGSSSGVATASGQKTEATTESGKGDLGSQAADIFTTELVKTGKFKVLDRKSFDKAVQKTEDEDALKAASSIGSHYLLTGTITEAGISETGGAVLGFGGKSVEGRVSLNISLTNVSTGEIILAESAEGNQSEGGVTLFGSEVAGKKDLGLLISKALRNAVENCLKKIETAVGDINNYPIECELAVSEGVVYLSKGKDDGVKVGDVFEVVGIGKTVKIGSKVIEEKVQKGKITVNSVENDYATAPAPFDFTVNDGDKGVKVVKK